VRNEVKDILHFCPVSGALPLPPAPPTSMTSASARIPCEYRIGDLDLARAADLRRFLAAEADRRPTLGSQARMVAALKSFGFVVENGDLNATSTLVLRRRKAEARPDVLDRRERAHLLKATQLHDVWQRQHAGQARVPTGCCSARFAYAGLRRSELLGLDWDDVDLERRLLRARKVRAGRQRTVAIHGPRVADWRV
jgi:integrase